MLTALIAPASGAARVAKLDTTITCMLAFQ